MDEKLSVLKKAVGAEFTRKRKELGLNLVEASKELGVSTVTLGKWEKGIWFPRRQDNLDNLFTLYGIEFSKSLPDIATVVGQEIKKNRKELSLTQETLASNLGVSKQSISLNETGQSTPSKVFLGKIEVFFDKKNGHFHKLIDNEMVVYYQALLDCLKE